MKRDRNAMIHWWYTPDSYDTWMPDVSPDLEIDLPQHSGAWEVSFQISTGQLILPNVQCQCFKKITSE